MDMVQHSNYNFGESNRRYHYSTLTDTQSNILPSFFTSSLQQMTPSSKHLFAGAVGTFTAVLTCYPLDLVKSRQAASFVHLEGPIGCFISTVQKEGFKGLYSGLLAPLVGDVLTGMFSYGIYGSVSQWLNNNNETFPHQQLSLLTTTLVAGGVAGVASAFVESPFDLVKIQLQTQNARASAELVGLNNRSYLSPIAKMADYQRIAHSNDYYSHRGILDCFNRISRANCLSLGFSSTLFRNVPGWMISYSVFEHCRQYFAIKRFGSPEYRKEIGLFETVLSGGLAGAAFWSICFPLDCVKVTVQSQHIKGDTRYNFSFLSTARNMYEEGGISRFYRGYSSAVLRSIPSSAIVYAVYTYVLREIS